MQTRPATQPPYPPVKRIQADGFASHPFGWFAFFRRILIQKKQRVPTILKCKKCAKTDNVSIFFTIT